MTQDSLKPCRICHGPAYTDADTNDAGKKVWWAGCGNCGIVTSARWYSKEYAIKQWNTRAAVQGGELVERIKSLLGEIVSMHADPESGDYNECDKVGEECLWCAQAKEAIAALSPPADRVMISPKQARIAITALRNCAYVLTANEIEQALEGN